MVKVKDRESGEVIRELPPEKSLDFLAKVWEMAGLLFDEKR
jgi:flagellar protein FlaG